MHLSSEQIGQQVAETDEGRYDEMMDVDVKGVYFSMQALSQRLRDGGSVILKMCFLSTVGFPGLSVLAASKATVRSLARSWTREFLDRKIRINAVSPGAIVERSRPPPLALGISLGGRIVVVDPSDSVITQVGHIVHLAGRQDPKPLLVGVNAGHVHSFAMDAAKELGWADVPDSGSQLRSRNIFPQAAVDFSPGGASRRSASPQRSRTSRSASWRTRTATTTSWHRAAAVPRERQ